MLQNKAYAAYANNKIMTASPAELTLMLYDGAIKLDDKYPVSKDFNNVYTYLHRRLVEANIKKDKEILEEVLEHLRTMRDAWKEVMQATCNGNKLHVS